MKLPEELLKKIGEATKEVVVNTINKIYEYQTHNSFCPDYYGYPEIFLKGLEEHESFKELKEKVPAFRCGIHFYHTTNYNTPKKSAVGGNYNSTRDSRYITVAVHA